MELEPRCWGSTQDLHVRILVEGANVKGRPDAHQGQHRNFGCSSSARISRSVDTWNVARGCQVASSGSSHHGHSDGRWSRVEAAICASAAGPVHVSRQHEKEHQKPGIHTEEPIERAQEMPKSCRGAEERGHAKGESSASWRAGLHKKTCAPGGSTPRCKPPLCTMDQCGTRWASVAGYHGVRRTSQQVSSGFLESGISHIAGQTLAVASGLWILGDVQSDCPTGQPSREISQSAGQTRAVASGSGQRLLSETLVGHDAKEDARWSVGGVGDEGWWTWKLRRGDLGEEGSRLGRARRKGGARQVQAYGHVRVCVQGPSAIRSDCSLERRSKSSRPL